MNGSYRKHTDYRIADHFERSSLVNVMVEWIAICRNPTNAIKCKPVHRHMFRVHGDNSDSISYISVTISLAHIIQIVDCTHVSCANRTFSHFHSLRKWIEVFYGLVPCLSWCLEPNSNTGCYRARCICMSVIRHGITWNRSVYHLLLFFGSIKIEFYGFFEGDILFFFYWWDH